eukprot:CAMPEP_0202819652 /NCGR_PEP_ID=MMETSP1389-20130828/9183_1 /ASSEMBLY_ACC=CAM_ASM_000865 /TAXON_ID=302021 /ORGANISM="Rhodomonas sp., Strain CCMP768" /LENGTH=241 /DNA_ID=CAMNT_0049492201 /DNA_START=207 /DNA_END=928 /DNA_ORIENTATION=-
MSTISNMLGRSFACRAMPDWTAANVGGREAMVARDGQDLPLCDQHVLDAFEVCLERPLPRTALHHHLPQYNGEREDVDGLCEALSKHLLRRHVRRRPRDRRRHKLPGLIKHTRAAEVCDLGDAVGCDEDVAGVEVPVDHAPPVVRAPPVQVRHPVRNLEAEGDLLGGRELPLRVEDVLLEAPAIAQLKHHRDRWVTLAWCFVRDVGEVGTSAPERHHVGVSNAHENVELEQELSHLGFDVV